MSVRRFHVGDVSQPVTRVAGPEAGHALRVLRLGVGGSVDLFDGQGHEARGRIISVSRGSFDVEVVSRTDRRSEVAASLTIATALPKGDRADWLVEKCAELSVSALAPLDCERATVRPGDAKLERLRRKVVAAAKQGGRSTIMGIESLSDVKEFLNEKRGQGPMAYGDPDATNATLTEWLRALGSSSEAVGPVTILIGPEGGFTTAERRLIEEAGGRAIRFATGILRIETACVAVAATWGEWMLSSQQRSA